MFFIQPIEHVYNISMKDILDEYEVTATGLIIDKTTNKPLRIKKGVRDNKVTIKGVEYSVKELVWRYYGEACPHSHFIGYIQKNPVGMNKDDIRNLKVVTWREYYGWNSADITPLDREIHNILTDTNSYKVLLCFKEEIYKGKSADVPCDQMLKLVVGTLGKFEVAAVVKLIDEMKKDANLTRVIEHEAEFMTDTPNNDFKGIEVLSNQYFDFNITTD